MSTYFGRVGSDKWSEALKFAYSCGPNIPVGLMGGTAAAVLALVKKVEAARLSLEKKDDNLGYEERLSLNYEISRIDNESKDWVQLSKFFFVSSVPVVGTRFAANLLSSPF